MRWDSTKSKDNHLKSAKYEKGSKNFYEYRSEINQRRFCNRSRCSLVPGVRRLCDFGRSPTRGSHVGSPEGKFCIHLRHRLLEPLPLLHEHLWISFDPWSSDDARHGTQEFSTRTLGLGGNGGW